MSVRVSPARAAQAALAAAAGAPAIAVVAVVHPGAAVERMIVHEDGAVEGTLGSAALDRVGQNIARDALAEADAAPRLVDTGDHGAQLYIEVHRAPDQLVIVGAGHIAVPLAHLGVLLGFAVTVIDDREDMATQERFDDGVRVLRADFASDPFAGVPIRANSFVALVTRGHRWDYDCLHRIIAGAAQPRYLGMIGSRRRVRAAFLALLESGVPRSLLATIRAPIGLELNAETPAEIAVAIAAEIVAVRHGSDIASISSRERVLERFLKETPE